MTRDQLTVTVDADTYVELVQAQKKLAALTPAIRTLRNTVAQYDASQPYVFPALGRDVIAAVRALLAGLPPDEPAQTRP